MIKKRITILMSFCLFAPPKPEAVARAASASSALLLFDGHITIEKVKEVAKTDETAAIEACHTIIDDKNVYGYTENGDRYIITRRKYNIGEIFAAATILEGLNDTLGAIKGFQAAINYNNISLNDYMLSCWDNLTRTLTLYTRSREYHYPDFILESADKLKKLGDIEGAIRGYKILIAMDIISSLRLQALQSLLPLDPNSAKIGYQAILKVPYVSRSHSPSYYQDQLLAANKLTDLGDSNSAKNGYKSIIESCIATEQERDQARKALEGLDPEDARRFYNSVIENPTSGYDIINEATEALERLNQSGR